MIANPKERQPLRLGFTVPAIPVAQPRPRATTRGGHAAVYEAKQSHPVHAYKASVRMAARSAYAGPPVPGPLSIEMTFIFPRPKGLIWKKRPMSRLPHRRKPDVDNIIKSSLDALNGLLFVDDSQVCDCRCQKLIASGDEQPHVVIVVTELPEDHVHRPFTLTS